MEQADLQPDAIRTVAVTTGPGSFTGVRIAISVAKGIALGATTTPALVGIPTLSVTAAPWIEAAHAEATPRFGPSFRLVVADTIGRSSRRAI